jgi:hypothetical protein
LTRLVLEAFELRTIRQLLEELFDVDFIGIGGKAVIAEDGL